MIKWGCSKYTWAQHLITQLVNHISTHSTHFTEASSIYVRNLIKSKTEFDQTTNQQINKLIQKIQSSLSKHTTSYQSNLNALVNCLDALYDAESIFYDDANILIGLVDKLTSQFKAKNLDRGTLINLVNLTCIAYKSNLIGNENLIDIHSCLSSDYQLNDLRAFYCRFLVAFGYGDAVSWLAECHSKWVKDLNDFRLVCDWIN